MFRQVGHRRTAAERLIDALDAWGGQGEYFLNLDGKRVDNSEYLSRRAIDFINACNADQPFCLIVLYKSPHDVQTPDPRDTELFDERRRSSPPKTAAPEYFDRLPEFMKVSMNRSRAVRDFPTPAKYQEYVKQYLRCIAGVDRTVGEIRKVIADRGFADDTLTIFASDNGYFLGERGLIHKWLMYEESIRVPLIVNYPRLVKKSQSIDEMALNIDVAPTFLDFAGVPIPDGTDGRSALDCSKARRTAGGRTGSMSTTTTPVGRRRARSRGPKGCARRHDWKYITYIDEKEPYEELYNLKSDPHEEHNLATDSKFAERLKEMKATYADYVKKLPPPVLPREATKKK